MNTIKSNSCKQVGKNPLPNCLTLMFARTPVRVLDRGRDVWIVLGDLCNALGVKGAGLAAWRALPEMDRDIDLFDRDDGKRVLLKVVHPVALPALLERLRVKHPDEFQQWVQSSFFMQAA